MARKLLAVGMVQARSPIDIRPASTAAGWPWQHFNRAGGVRLAGALIAIVLAMVAGGYLNNRLTSTMLEQATFRAADQVQLGVLDRGSAADLAPPNTDAKLNDLAARMEPMASQMQKAQSGLIRINVIGRDGTVLYSDAPGNRGHVVPVTKQPFAEALNDRLVGMSPVCPRPRTRTSRTTTTARWRCMSPYLWTAQW